MFAPIDLSVVVYFLVKPYAFLKSSLLTNCHSLACHIKEVSYVIRHIPVIQMIPENVYVPLLLVLVPRNSS